MIGVCMHASERMQDAKVPFHVATATMHGESDSFMCEAAYVQWISVDVASVSIAWRVLRYYT